ncbi:MAG: TIGR02757 family protein [Desulfuromonadia bacterium]
MEIIELLETLRMRRPAEHLSNDPLSFCHRFRDPVDQEIAALIAASFAYGSIGVIMRSLRTIFDRIGPSPRRFIETFQIQRERDHFREFRHRFNDGDDLVALFAAIRRIIDQWGEIGPFVIEGDDPRDPDITRTLDRFSTRVISFDYGEIFGTPTPRDNSTCKRLCLLFRWMARAADGVDLGLWGEISPSRLVIPVDRHIERISRLLGFTRRSTPSWRMAQEITLSLRRFDPHDPVKYDFSLAHLGISEGCDGKEGIACQGCHLRVVCPR